MLQRTLQCYIHSTKCFPCHNDTDVQMNTRLPHWGNIPTHDNLPLSLSVATTVRMALLLSGRRSGTEISQRSLMKYGGLSFLSDIITCTDAVAVGRKWGCFCYQFFCMMSVYKNLIKTPLKTEMSYFLMIY